MPKTRKKIKTPFLIWLLALILPINASAIGFSFTQIQEIITGGGAVSSVAEDFNEDGFEDLAIANSFSGTISILTGTEAGTFETPINLWVGNSPYSLASGDFNEDGHIDLAVTNWGSLSGNIVVLINDGAGSFSLSANLPTADTFYPCPVTILTSDFNNDGHLDLAVGHMRDNSVSLFLGSGDGSFSLPLNFKFGTEVIVGSTDYLGIMSIKAGDFNKDGNLDIAAVHSKDSKVFILFGNGNGSFISGTSLPIGSNSRSLVVADINGDGNNDLIAGGQDSMFVFLGNGNGNFLLKSIFTLGYLQLSFVTVDFNNDGNLDIAAPHFSNNTLEIMAGEGNGEFTEPLFTLPVGNRPRGVIAPDLNNDTLPDLVVTNQLSNSVSIFLNTAPPLLEVNIDIKPDSSPNCVNLKSNGSVSVAILGDGMIDVTEIDISSLELAGAAVLVKKNGEPQASFEDVNRDGFTDLILHFPVRNLRLTGKETSMELRGELKTGRPIKGSDDICFTGIK